MTDTEQMTFRLQALMPVLNEKQRRLAAAAEAKAAGHGGIAAAARASGIGVLAVRRGLKELAGPDPLAAGRVRRPGGGRKPITETQPGIREALRRMVEPATRGDPESPLRWCSRSLRKLAVGLGALGFGISFRKVGDLLRLDGYSLQANSKVLDGSKSPDRDAQFSHIAATAAACMAAGQPVVSVDTKKKELVGQYRNAGRELRPAGMPEEVDVHDFAGPLGRAAPYGVYDLAANAGWVSVGISHDTAEFAVGTLRRWLAEVGRVRYPDMTRLYVCCDGGGSNGSRLRLWKTELQRFADETGIAVTVSHYPPGTSKWNKIEHRLFSHITMNWRGKPLVDYATIVSLIGATTTTTGLTVRCVLDENVYEAGRRITEAEMRTLNITRDRFHGEWNYTISPRVTHQ